MKANKKPRDGEEYRKTNAFTFIVPMTMAIVVGFSILVIGAYVIGVIGSTLEATFADNQNHSGTWTFRSANENKTVTLIGNITTGFSDVVDIEIVVIIITALSMAILAIMAVGSRRGVF